MVFMKGTATRRKRVGKIGSTQRLLSVGVRSCRRTVKLKPTTDLKKAQSEKGRKKSRKQTPWRFGLGVVGETNRGEKEKGKRKKNGGVKSPVERETCTQRRHSSKESKSGSGEGRETEWEVPRMEKGSKKNGGTLGRIWWGGDWKTGGGNKLRGLFLVRWGPIGRQKAGKKG